MCTWVDAGTTIGWVLRFSRTVLKRCSISEGVDEYRAQSFGPARWQKW